MLPARLVYMGFLICVTTMLPQAAAAVIAPDRQLLVPIGIFAGGQVMGALLCIPQLFFAARQ